MTALVALAQNYANRAVILKEEWQRLVVAAMNNLTTESQEHIVRHAEGNEKVAAAARDAAFRTIPRLEPHCARGAGAAQRRPSFLSQVVIRTATRHSCDIAANGCRLFGVIASDPKLRENLAEEAIKACIVVMDFCDEASTPRGRSNFFFLRGAARARARRRRRHSQCHRDLSRSRGVAAITLGQDPTPRTIRAAPRGRRRDPSPRTIRAAPRGGAATRLDGMVPWIGPGGRFLAQAPTVQSAACDCLYNYCYRCEFAAMIADDLDALERVKTAVGNFRSDHAFQAQADRAVKVLMPGGWRGEETVVE